MSIDERPVLCRISVDTCPACIALKKIWPQIQDTLNASGLVRIVPIDLPTFNDKIDSSKYPEELSRLTSWAPTILLIDGRSWNSNLPPAKAASRLRYRVFNGTVDPTSNRSKLLPDAQLKSPTPDIILEWIKTDTFKLPVTPTITPHPQIGRAKGGSGSDFEVKPGVAMAPMTCRTRMRIRPRNS